MARFERPRERKGRKDSRGSSPRRDTRGKRDFEGGSRDRRDSSRDRRYSGRGSQNNSRDRRDIQMTKATCSSCGDECELPFKPVSSKPVYCRDCFAKRGKSGSDKISSKDIEIINEKLDKIIKALKIK